MKTFENRFCTAHWQRGCCLAAGAEPQHLHDTHLHTRSHTAASSAAGMTRPKSVPGRVTVCIR
jgi:hypothetical protein